MSGRSRLSAPIPSMPRSRPGPEGLSRLRLSVYTMCVAPRRYCLANELVSSSAYADAMESPRR